jgi:glucokinase
VPQACVIGVDLGGTNVRACAYLDDGTEAGAKFSNPSNAQESVEAVVESISLTVKQAVAASSVPPTAVGIGIPGHIDDAQGLVRWAPNFRMKTPTGLDIWRDVPLKSLVADQVGLPLHTGNDANVAALGEYRFGSGRGSAKCLVMITLGTGVGGGVIFAPDALHGRSTGPTMLLGGDKGGAELGHVCVDPISAAFGPGPAGDLESFCGTFGIEGRANDKLKAGRSSTLQGVPITPLALFNAAKAADAVALEVWAETGHFLGLGLGSFINMFAPDVLAIGGQVAKAGEFFLPAAIAKAKVVAIPTLFADTNIRVAERVEDAGILGAAALALEAIR